MAVEDIKCSYSYLGKNYISSDTVMTDIKSSYSILNWLIITLRPSF